MIGPIKDLRAASQTERERAALEPEVIALAKAAREYYECDISYNRDALEEALEPFMKHLERIKPEPETCRPPERYPLIVGLLFMSLLAEADSFQIEKKPGGRIDVAVRTNGEVIFRRTSCSKRKMSCGDRFRECVNRLHQGTETNSGETPK